MNVLNAYLVVFLASVGLDSLCCWILEPFTAPYYIAGRMFLVRDCENRHGTLERNTVAGGVAFRKEEMRP